MNDSDDRLVAGFWRAVAAEGWSALTMRRVAAEAGIDLAALRARAPRPSALLLLHAELADRAALEGSQTSDAGTPRDRLFDVVMRRIDALQPHRAGILRALRESDRDPRPALTIAASVPVTAAWLLEGAAIDAVGLDGLAKRAGAAAIWLATVRAWARDESEELGATMAALDRALDRAEQTARSLGLRTEPVSTRARPAL